MTRSLSVELLYIDIDTCTRCQGADSALAEAVAEVAAPLRSMGIDLTLRNILVEDETMAEAQKLVSSPTIRVNGRDIQPDPEESACGPCGDLTNSGSIDCRVWTWRGERYTSPPKGLIVEALMKAALSGAEAATAPAGFALPENLRTFFRTKKADTAQSCCASSCGCG